MDQPGLNFEDYRNLAHWVTLRLRGRAARNGFNLEYEDVFQEVAMIWVKCRDGFDPSKGVKFSTYFANAGLKSYKRVVGAIMGDPEELNYEDFSASDTDDDQHFLDRTADPSAVNPEMEAMRNEHLRQVLLKDNPLLAKLVELSIKQPPELMAQLEAARAHRALAQQMGVPTNEGVPVALTPQIIGRMMRFNWRKRKELKYEEA